MNPRIRMKISQCTLNDIEKFETPGSENCRFAMGQDHSEAGASTIKSNSKNVNGGVKPLTVRYYGQIMGQYYYEAGVKSKKYKCSETI